MASVDRVDSSEAGEGGYWVGLLLPRFIPAYPDIQMKPRKLGGGSVGGEGGEGVV